MFGIIKENKFVLIDEDKQKLVKTLELMPQYSAKEIREYRDDEIDIGYDGNRYLKGFAPFRPNEETEKLREKYYQENSDKFIFRKIRKQAIGTWTDKDEVEFLQIMKQVSNDINEKYSYIEGISND